MKDNRPFYFWISDAVINDFFHFAHLSDLTRFHLTHKVPYLLSKCEQSQICPNHLFPDLLKGLDSVEFHLGTSSPPNVHLQSGSASIAVNGTIGAYGHSEKGLENTIAEITVNLKGNLKIQIKNDRLTGIIVIDDLKIKVTQSMDEKLKIFLETGMAIVISPVLEELMNLRLAEGLKIPVLMNMKLKDPIIHLLQNTVQVATDLDYQPEKILDLESSMKKLKKLGFGINSEKI